MQNVSPWPVGTYGRRPRPGSFRYSWITPLAISPRPPHAVYQASQVLWRSTDGGRSWQTISPDLTGAAKDAPNCQGDVRVENATACGYGVIFAIAPSPAADGVVWVGTDNGRVQLTRDEGQTWQDVTPPGMSGWTKVNIIDVSPSDPATAYVAADRHRLGDDRPLVMQNGGFENANHFEFWNSSVTVTGASVEPVNAVAHSGSWSVEINVSGTSPVGGWTQLSRHFYPLRIILNTN